MRSKIKVYAEQFVEGMDDISEALDQVPIKDKTGMKIGLVLGMNPVTGPILGGLTVGAVATYGVSLVVKQILEITENDKRYKNLIKTLKRYSYGICIGTFGHGVRRSGVWHCWGRYWPNRK